ncbi:MAG TPA: hypothetical protein VM285_12325 [Polyangia bacterium]|nr:hypothetical protein [Polyangia bacterium]
MDVHVAVWGVVIVVGSLLFADRSILLGALAGAVLALVNWLGFRWAAVRLALVAQRGRFMLFLALKSGAVLGAVTLVLWTRLVHPLAFAAGLSALVAGVISRFLAEALVEGAAALGEQEK